MDQALAALHHGNPRRCPLTFGFARHRGEVTLFCCCPDDLEALLEGQLYAHYPELSMTPLPDEAFAPPAGMLTWTSELRLSPDLFPCKRYGQFLDDVNRITADPLTAILTTIAGDAESPLHPVIELIIRPARPANVARAKRCIWRLASQTFFRRHPHLAHLYITFALSRRWTIRCMAFFLGRLAQADRPESKALEASGSRLHEREEDLQAASEKAGRPLFEATIRLRVSGPHNSANEARRTLRAMAAAFGQFTSPRLTAFRSTRVRKCQRIPRPRVTQLLSTEELATLWHPATLAVRSPTMTTVESKQTAPPVRLPTIEKHADVAVLGTAVFRGAEQQCGILPDDRRRHLYVCGKTGMGKSTLLHRLIASDIAAGHGAGLLDPHGDLVEAVLAVVPSHRTNDIVLFDASDTAFPLSFNVLACGRPDQKALLVSGVIAGFKKIWGEFFGPRMEHIMRNALFALLEVPGTSLLSLLRFLSERGYRDGIVRRLSDPVVKAFWDREFGSWSSKFQVEAVAPILNKAGAFASNPVLRHIIGQSRSTLDLRAVMDEGRVLLCNLSKGRIGEDASALLGSFLITGLQLAAMSRADMREVDRRDFYLAVDEFQNYATDSFATILSEARKYRLSLTLAHQYLAQVPEETLSAVWGNAGSMIVFQVGVEDAESLAEQLGGELSPADLLALPTYHAYTRLLIDGQPSRPFSMRTLPPIRGDDVRTQIIRRLSRERYGREAETVARDIQSTFAML